MNSQNADLQAWLRTATDELTPFAKERIQFEVEAHYVEAVENHAKEGLTETDAQKKALQELGEAKVAARRFRQRRLTENEAKRLARQLKAARSLRGLLLSVACLMAVIVMFYHFAHEIQYAPGPRWFALFAAYFIWLLGRYATARTVMQLSAMSGLAIVFTSAIILANLQYHENPLRLHSLVLISFLIYFTATSVQPVRQLALALKIRKVADLDQELREAS